MTRESGTALVLAVALLAAPAALAAPEGVESSYHGQLGLGSGLGMLEKWCALPNFSFEEQGGILSDDGTDGWTTKDCNGCHIGAAWNPTRPAPDCYACHVTAAGDEPTIAKCLTCHKKDKAKRGDNFTSAADVHIAASMVCQDCHLKMTAAGSDHQFAKGRAIDTTEPTVQGTLTCATCHEGEPHPGGTTRAAKLNQHLDKVACETCHTGIRAAGALVSRSWVQFTSAYKPTTVKQSTAWMPVHKWYDNKGAGAAGDYHLPILGFTERKRAPGAKIYPFNAVTVDWFVKKKNSSYDDVVIVPELIAADMAGDGDFTVTAEELEAFGYRKATLVSEDMNFSISHSVGPATTAFECNDCHGKNGWVLDWKQLGYKKDPGGGNGKKK